MADAGPVCPRDHVPRLPLPAWDQQAPALQLHAVQRVDDRIEQRERVAGTYAILQQAGHSLHRERQSINRNSEGIRNRAMRWAIFTGQNNVGPLAFIVVYVHICPGRQMLSAI
jgi:hypothetical protein